MHNTGFVTIPAEKIGRDYSKEHISKIVDSIVEPYYIETAPDSQAKFDGYKIGGRWAGFIGTKPDAKSSIPSSNGRFAYEIGDMYEYLLNDGQPGQYKLGSLEVIPVDGAAKEDIIWDSMDRLQTFVHYTAMKMIFEKNPRAEGLNQDSFLHKDDGLYVDSDVGPILMYKKDETFDEYVERKGITFERSMMLPDAYIDKEGNWHTVNGLWLNHENPDMLITQDDPDGTSYELFLNQFFNYIVTDLIPEDYILVLDCHC